MDNGLSDEIGSSVLVRPDESDFEGAREKPGDSD